MLVFADALYTFEQVDTEIVDKFRGVIKAFDKVKYLEQLGGEEEFCPGTKVGVRKGKKFHPAMVCKNLGGGIKNLKNDIKKLSNKKRFRKKVPK